MCARVWLPGGAQGSFSAWDRETPLVNRAGWVVGCAVAAEQVEALAASRKPAGPAGEGDGPPGSTCRLPAGRGAGREWGR